MISNTCFSLITEKDKTLPFYLSSIGCDYIQECVDRPNGFPTYQWIQCVSGEGEVVIDGNKQPISKHQGMFLYPDIPHKYYAISEEWKVNWISFLGNGVDNILKLTDIEESGVFYLRNSEILSSKMKKILNISQSRNNLKNIEASALIYEMLLDLFMYVSKSNDDSTEAKFLKLEPVLEYIDKNYNKVITLEELANSIEVTPQHLCLVFKNITGVRPFEYINSVRISKSKDLIISNSKININEIARQVGYDNTSYFCAMFKKLEGISPGNFKKLYW